MKRAFSLFEIIIVIVIISIISSFIISKTNNSLNKSIKTKIKSEIALIRNNIKKKSANNILLKKELLTFLDEASINTENSKLFSKILDFPLISTTKEKKVLGQWIKTSDVNYINYISEKEKVEFTFENISFICKSETSLCNEYE